MVVWLTWLPLPLSRALTWARAPPLSRQNLEKQMRQLAVIPPMLYDADQQRIKFINMNGLMDDPMKVYKDRQVMNLWSEQEKDTFREK